MANRFSPTNAAFTTFKKSISKSFVLDGICTEEIIARITNLKNLHLRTGIDGISASFSKLAKGTVVSIRAALFNRV